MRGRKCAGHKRERDAHYPGRSADLRSGGKKLAELAASRGGARGWQKSAEGIVGLSLIGPKARTSRKERSFHFDGEGDADKEGREAQIFWWMERAEPAR